MPAFFKKDEKELAKRASIDTLHDGYERSEKQLNAAARTGNVNKVKAAMKKHHKWEYALLYKNVLIGRKKSRANVRRK